jgi:hypothetical protein
MGKGGGGIGRNLCKFWWGNHKESDHLPEICEDGKKILKRNLKGTGWKDENWNYVA